MRINNIDLLNKITNACDDNDSESLDRLLNEIPQEERRGYFHEGISQLDGKSIYHYAATNAGPEVLKILSDRDPTCWFATKDKSYETPLFDAITARKVENLKYIIDQSHKEEEDIKDLINLKSKSLNKSALDCAYGIGNAEIIGMLELELQGETAGNYD